MEALGLWPSPQSPLLTPPAVLGNTTRWQAAVQRSLRQLGQALVLAVRAVGRVLAGVAGYADYLVAGRGRVLSPLETNPP